MAWKSFPFLLRLIPANPSKCKALVKLDEPSVISTPDIDATLSGVCTKEIRVGLVLFLSYHIMSSTGTSIPVELATEHESSSIDSSVIKL